LTGGVANLKNVYIEAPISTNDRMGMISCHAGSGYVFDNVYLVGGTGTIHSTSTSNNANYVYDNATYGKGMVGEAEIYETTSDMLSALEGNLPEFLKDFFSIGE
jgi:hypothetical protein